MLSGTRGVFSITDLNDALAINYRPVLCSVMVIL